MERPEYHPIPPDEVDKEMEKQFPKREQTRKALDDNSWKDVPLEDNPEENK